jgi:copper chaperone CopZ
MVAPMEYSMAVMREIRAMIREYAVVGMSCEHCVRAVREELGRVPGLGHVQVDLPAGRVRVTALGRVGEPDDIGLLIAALLSDDGRWITAQNIEVAGGYNL